MARWKLGVVAAAVLFCQVGVFYLQALRCQFHQQPVEASADADLRVLIVSDVHILGKRRRTWPERVWVDWQVHWSARAAVDVHKPDVALVLGDQFDEGTRWTPDSDWEVGNHDTSFGREMRLEDVKRYEVTFGPSNRIDMIGGHAFVSLNSMALDSDVANKAVKAEARSVDFAELRAQTNGSVILLTHLPLFRIDDLQCGEERLREAGHITYEHPGFQYETHHHVLSRKLSAELLAKVRPDLVLSGHTHAWCAYQHPDAAAMEYTIPTFSWGQRPDPSYALLRLRRPNAVQLEVEAPVVTACHLPRESLIFTIYAVTAAVVGLVPILRRLLTARTAKTKGA
ncbi:hypothetical protein BBJ28_00006387 [Nothophytophthora sp. Chile5]|nr:hypothetical protein BBJ28_00006387 [Nothophytophthora sp. Chile5]